MVKGAIRTTSFSFNHGCRCNKLPILDTVHLCVPIHDSYYHISIASPLLRGLVTISTTAQHTPGNSCSRQAQSFSCCFFHPTMVASKTLTMPFVIATTIVNFLLNSLLPTMGVELALQHRGHNLYPGCCVSTISKGLWRNGSAFDSRSKGYPFKSGGAQSISFCSFWGGGWARRTPFSAPPPFCLHHPLSNFFTLHLHQVAKCRTIE
jgi:hypothetical protein